MFSAKIIRRLEQQTKKEKKKNSSRTSLFSFMTLPSRSDDDDGDNDIQLSRCGWVECADQRKKLLLIFSDKWNKHPQRFSHLCSGQIFWWVILSSLHNDRFWEETMELLSNSFVFWFIHNQHFDHFQLWRIIFDLLLVQSFNQPRFCSNASWNPNATTFAQSSIVGTLPLALFITTKNTIVVPRRDNGQIVIWQNNASGTPTTTIPASLSGPFSVFVTSDEHIFVHANTSNGRVERWTLNGTRLSSTLFNCSRCRGLFVDVNNHLYCSAHDAHQVLRQSLSDPSSVSTVMAGTGCPGSTDEMLNNPHGIFVTSDLDLYVADYENSRVQLFRGGQRNGSTVAGNGSNGTIDLLKPTGVVIDADGYLFIVDQWNHRIVGSDRNGFRCLVGCSRVQGAKPNQLNVPSTMSFDMDGNIFVTDYGNSRIRKFGLTENSCGKDRKCVAERSSRSSISVD